MASPTVVVALIPGFLGFDAIGNFRYFSQRIADCLQTALLDALSVPSKVVALDTMPTAGLRFRQRTLLTALEAIKAGTEGPLELHLLGHSTGGLDAQLLVYDRPLLDEGWNALDGWGVRRCLRSVISLCAPHHGTGLASDPLAQFARRPVKYWRTAGDFARVMAKLQRSLRGDPELEVVAESVRRALPRVLRFATQSLLHGELVEDLHPEAVAAMREGRRVELEVTHRSIVTVAAVSSRNAQGGVRRPDAFFAELSARTAGSTSAAIPAVVQRNAAVVRSALQRRVIANPAATLPSIDARVNDGVVNTARQVLDPDAADEVAAVVVGDHMDVIGLYDRPSGRTPRQRGPSATVRTERGFLHSGSGFDDTTFAALYCRVAKTIAAASRYRNQALEAAS